MREARAVYSASGSDSHRLEGQEFEEGFRADLIIEGKGVFGLKSVEMIHPVHRKNC